MKLKFKNLKYNPTFKFKRVIDGNFHSQWRYFVLRKGEEFEYKEVQLLDGRYRYDLKNTKEKRFRLPHC